MDKEVRPKKRLGRLREWRTKRRQRWVDKQSAKRPGDSFTDLWKGGFGSGG